MCLLCHSVKYTDLDFTRHHLPSQALDEGSNITPFIVQGVSVPLSQRTNLAPHHKHVNTKHWSDHMGMITPPGWTKFC